MLNYVEDSLLRCGVLQHSELPNISIVEITSYCIEFRFVGRYNSWDDEMMAARWKVFNFFSQILEAKQREIRPFRKYFCDLVLMNEL